MTCKEFSTTVTDYLDAALSAGRRAAFDDHRAGCANCRIYFEQMQMLIRAAPALREDPGEVTVPSRLYQLLAEKNRPTGRGRYRQRYSRYWPLLIPVGIIVIVLGMWLYRSRYAVRPSPQAATVDLSHWLILRGIEQPAHVPIVLPHAQLDLTLMLPLGYQPGEYQVGISRGRSKPFLTVRGTATLIDHISTIHMKLDLTTVHRGLYHLAVRPDAWGWAYFPLKIN